jgi:hypothetical protein
LIVKGFHDTSMSYINSFPSSSTENDRPLDGGHLKFASVNYDWHSMKHFRYLLITVAIAAGLPASAHDTLPENWCSDPRSESVIVAEFSFNEEELFTLEEEMGLADIDDATLNGPKGLVEDTCGIVDRSPWHSAMHIGSGTCEALAPGQDAQLIVLGPESYDDPKHHTEYSFTQGLKGVCVVCPPPPKPVRPEKTPVKSL